MIIALCLISVVAGIAVVGASVAADSARGSASDRWLISGPHSYH